jgi:SAM-dependent methyltransferase
MNKLPGNNMAAPTPADLENFPEGVRILLGAVLDKADFPLRAARMASAMRTRDMKKQKPWQELALWARALAPDDYQVRMECNWALRKHVPGWHFPLVHDAWRNDLYAQALKRFITPKTIVLEIGSGTGILAMLAAQAGARHVYSCEMEPLLAEAARENIQKNGFEERITVISKKSTDLEIGRDLPGKADLCVSELVDIGLLREDVLPIMEDAMDRLLTDNALILPGTIASMGVLVGGAEWTTRCRVEKVSGFDLSAINRFAPPVCPLSGSQVRNGLQGAFCEPFGIFSFSLARNNRFPAEQKELAITAERDGGIDGLLSWIRLTFSDDIVLENRPPQQSAWVPQLHLFPEPIQVRKGDTVRLIASHDRKQITILPGSCL